MSRMRPVHQRDWNRPLSLLALVAVAGFLISVHPLAISNGLSGQAATNGPNWVSICTNQSCQVTLTKVVSLSAKGHALQIPVPYVVQDPMGRFMTRTSLPTEVVLFDRSGRFLSSLVLSKDAERGTTVLIASPGKGALAWLSPSTEAFTIGSDFKATPSSSRVPYLPSFVRSDGSVVVSQQIQDAKLVGYPLHLVSPQGQIRKSFGAEPPEYRADLPLFMDRVAAPAADDMVWAVAKGRYVLERWNPTLGVRLARVPVRSSWFVEAATYPKNELTRPTPVIQSLWERDGLIWVLIRDADKNWKASTDPERRWSPTTAATIYDWVVEVIDPASGSVLASSRFGSPLIGRPPQAVLVSYATTGAEGLDVWMPVLARKE